MTFSSTIACLNNHSSKQSSSCFKNEKNNDDDNKIVTAALQKQQSEQKLGDGKILFATRCITEREKYPDRICLDKRDLTTFPWIVDEKKLRLLSLQHNLITKLEKNCLVRLNKLLFLDLYDNRIEKLCDLDPLENLRVLLIGKNKIKKIEGIGKLKRLEVLDLHGNQINQISGLDESIMLKVLNLAGNNIKCINQTDFQGLAYLKELNLKRNKIKKLPNLDCLGRLQKLYLSNNEIQKIEDMGGAIKAGQLKEITLDGNPVNLSKDCLSFLISFLPNLQSISNLRINEQLRKNAMAWRTSKEEYDSAFLDLNSAQVCVRSREDIIIGNTKINWEIDKTRSGKNIMIEGNAKKVPEKTTITTMLLSPNNPVIVQRRPKSNELDKTTTTTTTTSFVLANKSMQIKRCYGKSKSLDNNNIVNKNEKEKSQRNKNVGGLDFKLPPILAPIIDNLTNNNNFKRTLTNRTIKKKGTKKNYYSSTNSSNDSSDIDDRESSSSSSESHHSLKSGLRSHLIRSSTSDNSINKCSTIVIPRIDEDTRGGPFNNKKWTVRGLLTSSISKSSSMDSSKSIIIDDCSSSINSSTSKSSSTADKNNKSAAVVLLARVTSAPSKKSTNYYRTNRAATARVKKKTNSIVASSSSPLSNSIQSLTQFQDREQGKDYLVEIVEKCLNVYGQGAARHIDKQWDTSRINSDVNVVKFCYVHFNEIAGIFNKLKQKFPNADRYCFKETNICYIGQLNALAEIQGLNSIEIEEGNPIIMTKNWFVYAIFRLSHWGLETMNGIKITEDNISNANDEYSGLVDIVLSSLPDSLLQPLMYRLNLEVVQKRMTAKEFLFSCDSALRNVVSKEALQWRRGHITQDDLIWRHKGKIFLSNSIDQTVKSIQKLKIMNDEWPNILCEIIYDTLINYSNMNDYMKKCINELETN